VHLLQYSGAIVLGPEAENRHVMELREMFE
jgi:hypothetical protein